MTNGNAVAVPPPAVYTASSISEEAEGSSRKRKHEEDVHSDAGGKKRLAKLHPLFVPSSSDFKWLQTLGTNATCLHGLNLAPQSRSKVAAFDLDGTVIGFDGFPYARKYPLKWRWWHACVPTLLKQKYLEGFSIVLVSNQKAEREKKSHMNRLEEWKKKITLIAAVIPDVPFRIFVATAEDNFRKPNPGIWNELVRIYAADGVSTIDKTVSFYVGDAAGRPTDFAASDRDWAKNIGLTFLTPEEFFLYQKASSLSIPAAISFSKQRASTDISS